MYQFFTQNLFEENRKHEENKKNTRHTKTNTLLALFHV